MAEWERLWWLLSPAEHSVVHAYESMAAEHSTHGASRKGGERSA